MSDPKRGLVGTVINKLLSGKEKDEEQVQEKGKSRQKEKLEKEQKEKQQRERKEKEEREGMEDEGLKKNTMARGRDDEQNRQKGE